MPKKNETTLKPVPGIMAITCARCKDAVLFPVSIELFSRIKAYGNSEKFQIPCERCGDTVTLTLEA